MSSSTSVSSFTHSGVSSRKSHSTAAAGSVASNASAADNGTQFTAPSQRAANSSHISFNSQASNVTSSTRLRHLEDAVVREQQLGEKARQDLVRATKEMELLRQIVEKRIGTVQVPAGVTSAAKSATPQQRQASTSPRRSSGASSVASERSRQTGMSNSTVATRSSLYAPLSTNAPVPKPPVRKK